MLRIQFILLLGLLLLASCEKVDPNLNQKGQDEIRSHLFYTDSSIQDYRDTVYVPVYSDIYSDDISQKILLTATLSIRSTSLTDTTYINSIDYFNSKGDKVKSFVDSKVLVLNPMSTIDYVIERNDNSGGTGANFIIDWGAKHNTHPLFQCVMISFSGQKGLAFSVDGVSTKNK